MYLSNLPFFPVRDLVVRDLMSVRDQIIVRDLTIVRDLMIVRDQMIVYHVVMDVVESRCDRDKWTPVIASYRVLAD